MSYTQLNARERMSLFYLHQFGLSKRAIGRQLNRSHTTISRELKRNKRVMGCYCDRAAKKSGSQKSQGQVFPCHICLFNKQKTLKKVGTLFKRIRNKGG